MKQGIKLSEQQKSSMSRYGIPERMQGGIIRFYENRIAPGHFLSAVIDNDLRGAFERADDENQHLLKAYVMWFYNSAPGGTWGFHGATAKWTNGGEE